MEKNFELNDQELQNVVGGLAVDSSYYGGICGGNTGSIEDTPHHSGTLVPADEGGDIGNCSNYGGICGLNGKSR